MKRSRAIVMPLLALAAIAVAIPLWIEALADDGPRVPTLVIGNPDHGVIDLLRQPDEATAEVRSTAPGSTPEPLAFPTPTGRFLVVQLRKGSAVAGWAERSGDEPAEVVTFAEAVTMVCAFPHPREAGVAILQAMRGWSPKQGRVEVTVHYSSRK